MANTKISALTALTTPTWNEEFVYAYNNANGKITLNTMKTFVGSTWITTLNANANIWELSEWFYESEYKLFYKSWEDITDKWTLFNVKTLIFVVVNSDGGRGYLAFWEKEWGWNYYKYSCFGYSKSSSVWSNAVLNSWDTSLKRFGTSVEATWQSTIQGLSTSTISQAVENIEWTNNITISSEYPPYVWMTYTIYVDSVASGENYTVGLWTGVTNPLNITLPSASNKKCVITLLITSTTTAVITGCTIEA